MIAPRTRTAAVLAACLLVVESVCALRAQEPAPPLQGERAGAEAGHAALGTPVRLSFVSGEVSFWRPGAEDWVGAQINTPIGPGDALYAADGASLELQIGPRAFVRAGADTQIEIEDQEPDFLQLKVAAGHASLDVRSIKAGYTIEMDTPAAAFTIETSGYYRLDVSDATTTFITRRGGRATMTAAAGEASAVAPSEEVVIQGTDTPTVETYAAPDLDAWDHWNYERTDHLIDAVSARYVAPSVYGIDALDHYGTWRVTGDYGPVWVPSGVAVDWAPYSVGRWIWEPYYGWTWVDDAPWGWAPCHYGRWVHVSEYWAWAPGPLVAVPVYSPAVVAFFGGPHFGVSIGIGAPAIGWVALGWGEPVVPWWGGPGFIGVPSWHGWGGPRIVNNVVVERNTVINVNNINIYQNVNVRNAVVATREDRFGRAVEEHVRVPRVDPHQLEPLHGRVPVQPVAASLVPRIERARRPPETILKRSVVATRPPRDVTVPLRAAGLNVANNPIAPPRIVRGPRGRGSALEAPRPAFGQRGSTERPQPAQPPQFGRPHEAQPRALERGRGPAERAREGGTMQPGSSGSAPRSQPERRVPGLHERRAPAGREAAPQAAPPPPQAAPPREPVPRHAMPHEVAPHPAPPVPPPRQAAPSREAVPRAPIPREAGPRHPAPPQAPPPPVERHVPAARPEPPARSLPGEPANRVFRPQPEVRVVPHPQAPAPPPRAVAPPPRAVAPAREAGPRRRQERP